MRNAPHHQPGPSLCPLLLADAALLFSPSPPPHLSLLCWIIPLSMQTFSSIPHLRKKKNEQQTQSLPIFFFLQQLPYGSSSSPGHTSFKGGLSYALSTSSSSVFCAVHLSQLPPSQSAEIALFKVTSDLPPFAKSGKHVFVFNFLSLLKALGRLTPAFPKGSPLGYLDILSLYPAQTTGLSSVPFASSLSLA